ncbi:MAG TPA: hypothetical protein VF528_05965 [Pyrinomonadaceae bacterium]|jgi:hypothetical protein
MKQVNLLLNMVVDWTGEKLPRVERVIWIDRGNSCALIRLNGGKQGKRVKALPYLMSTSDLKEAISSGEARIVDDPYKTPKLQEHEIPANHKLIRDEAWEVIEPLVKIKEIWRLFDPRTRGPLVARREQELQKNEDKNKRRTKKIIYRYLQRYWQGGQTKNALLPFYENSGARGVPRHEKANEYKKLGRKKNRTKADPEQKDLGVNIDERSHRYILLGAKMFYERSHPKLTLKQAYEETLKRFFNIGYGLPRAPWAPIPPDADEAPSLDQFKYHYRLNRKLKRMIEAREGKHAFRTKHREVLGDSTQAADGPGAIFQVDATLADVYLCSLLEPSWIIGRPIVYIITDVFSRLITGFSVGLIGPSWEGACLALLNTFSDKVEFCRQYGVRVTAEEWPSCHLPNQLLADCGEFKGNKADVLVNALGIEVLNTPAYTPDWKSIVEQQFNMINRKVNKRMPGYVYKRAPGEPRCELDAALNIHEFRRIMISYIIEHNLERRLNVKDYPMSREMIAAGVDPYPINIWNWGVNNESGSPKKKDDELIRVTLLPEGTASLKFNGLEFKNARYSCPWLLENEWFLKAGQSGAIDMKVSYDPRFREPIYLRLDDGRRIEPCYLIERDKRFKDCDLYETEDYFAKQMMEQDASKTREYRASAEHSAFRQSIVDVAVKRRDKETHGMSDSARLKDKGEKRKDEVALLQQTDYRGQPESPCQGAPARIINFDRSDRQLSEESHIGPANYAEEFDELD